ncbi:MAG: cadmium-translocating P-type ATPase [Treponema sp.]|jgi:Cd2+/Zn2+-exporting ATPase|nr:cadmium-translocating P-type ATPase [Treponema sp.]
MCTACTVGKPEDMKKNDEAEKIDNSGLHLFPTKRIIVFGSALVLWIVGMIVHQLQLTGVMRFTSLAIFIPAYLLAGLSVLKNAFRNLRNGNALDENFLMSIATIGAFAIGEWPEAVGVMMFYMIGEMIQDSAVERSRKSINALLALKPDSARIKKDDEWIEVKADDVAINTLVLVRPGERIPLDGIIIEGSGSIDASMLTGESKPIYCNAGDEVRSGTISLDGVITINTLRTAGNSSAAKIIELVEKASESKAKPERFITAFAKWYTPIVVGITVLLAILPPLFIPGATFSEWIYRALILLVISCPCALVVSVPLGYFAGIGGMSRRGIMVKGALHLDSLKKTVNVAFDKTGTLTTGKFSVNEVECADGVDEEHLLDIAVLAERESNHPMAKAIHDYAEKRYMYSAVYNPVAYKEVAGKGIIASIENGPVVLAGNAKLLLDHNVVLPELSSAKSASVIYLAKDNRYMGRILIGDTIKEGAAEAISKLKKLGMKQIVMFTGDKADVAAETASNLGIETVKAELLPEDKLSNMEALCKNGTTIFVGDGINDAPVLARADVGIAMGSGADAAVETANVIIMTDDPRRVPEAIERSRRTYRVIVQNVIFALAFKLVFIALASLGFANMWMALVADVGVALLAILNASRVLK